MRRHRIEVDLREGNSTASSTDERKAGHPAQGQPCYEHRHCELLVRNIVNKEITEESAAPAGWVAGRDSARRTGLDWRPDALPEPGSSPPHLLRHFRAGSKEHLVGSLPGKRWVRHLGAVLGNVEFHECTNPRHRVQRVQEEPLMLQGAPERLHHGVGEADLELRQDAIEAGGEQGGIHLTVDVLHAGIGVPQRPSCIYQMLARRKQDPARVRRIEPLRHCPRQDLAREVVHHRLKVDLRAVDQLDDTGIDMPDLVWSGGTDTEGGLVGMDAPARRGRSRKHEAKRAGGEQPRRAHARVFPNARWNRARPAYPGRGGLLSRPRPVQKVVAEILP
jgi:hypothetical protein